MMSRRQFSALLPAALLGPRAVVADDWPSRPVMIVVPFAPGGATDIVARQLAEELKRKFGQNFLIENRGGAAGNIGIEAVVRSAPDGYTLLFGTMGSLTTNPHLYKDAKFNVQRDLIPISKTFKVDHVLVVNQKMPARTVKEFVELARAAPGKYTYGSAGVGSSVQMFAILLEMKAGIRLVHVPYRGSAPALADLMAGNIDILMDSVPTSLGQIQAGNTRALAVTSGTRNVALSDVPTMMEAGIPDYDTAAWGALLAPAGTPQSIVDRLSQAVQEAYRNPALQKKFADIGVEAASSTPQELAELIRTDTELWGRVVEAGKLHIN